MPLPSPPAAVSLPPACATTTTTIELCVNYKKRLNVLAFSLRAIKTTRKSLATSTKYKKTRTTIKASWKFGYLIYQ